MRVPHFVAVVSAAAVLALGAGTLVLAHGGDPTLVHSCVNKDGEITIVSAAAVCKKDEIALDWNITGPVGATGAGGAAGRDGRDGLPGATGPAGPAGRDGASGATGTQGPKGDTGPQGPAGKSGDANGVVVGQLSATGAVQGSFTGGDGSTALIDVRSFSADVSSPRDLATGQASGKRQYKPLMITKQMDAATPLFHKALGTNELLSSVVLKIYRPGTTTVDETITLTQASVSEITNAGSGAADALPLETLSITFQSISYEFSFGGVTRTFSDSPFTQ